MGSSSKMDSYRKKTPWNIEGLTGDNSSLVKINPSINHFESLNYGVTEVKSPVTITFPETLMTSWSFWGAYFVMLSSSKVEDLPLEDPLYQKKN